MSTNSLTIDQGDSDGIVLVPNPSDPLLFCNVFENGHLRMLYFCSKLMILVIEGHLSKLTTLKIIYIEAG
jgi:hypothetical protein